MMRHLIIFLIVISLDKTNAQSVLSIEYNISYSNNMLNYKNVSNSKSSHGTDFGVQTQYKVHKNLSLGIGLETFSYRFYSSQIPTKSERVIYK